MEQVNVNQKSTYIPPVGSPSPQGVPTPPPMYVRAKWPPVVGNGLDTVFMVITLLFSVFAVHSVLFAGFFKLGFTAAYVLWFILENIYIFTKSKPKLSAYPVLLGLLSLAASGVFAVYNDEAIGAALVLMAAFANAMYFLLLSGQNRYNPGEIETIYDAFRYCIILPFAFIKEPFRSAFSVKSNEKKKGKSVKTLQIILGIVISVPLAAILIALLSNADAAFKGLIDKLFSNLLLSIAKLLLGAILFPLLLSPAFALRYNITNRDYTPAPKKNPQTFPSTISITVLSVISAVYFVYLLAQLAYFFDAFKGILPENYSASAYARRGFFELCAICALNAVFIALSMRFAKRDSKGSEVLHKILQIFISCVSLVIAASSFSKMYLYIQMYGLTRKRVLTSIFILMLCVVFLALIVRILAQKFPYMKVIAVACFAVLIAVGYLDIDANIAKYNYHLYKTNKTIAAHYENDGAFINELGDSAADYVKEFAEHAKGDVQACAQSRLCEWWGMENMEDFYAGKLSKCDTVLSYNMARVQATRVLDEMNATYHYVTFHQKMFATNDDYFAVVKQMQPNYCYDYSYYNFDPTEFETAQ